MLLIYVSKITNRLRYIFEFIFDDWLGIPFSITKDKEEFIAAEGAKLNYSNRQFKEELFFYASTLLFERGIKKQRIKLEEFEEVPIFFISKSNSDLPFDLFAASFYLLSRYEEYLSDVTDRFGRFPAEESLAYQAKCLQIPLIDIWITKLKAVLQKHYPDLLFKTRTYQFTPTYDIDVAYAYLYKGWLRTIGGYAVAVKNGRFSEVWRRTKVLLGRQKDPYDTYYWQLKLHKKYKLNPIYFFLVGEYGVYDKNISIHHRLYQNLIQTTGDYYDVGIHPSYQSNQELRVLNHEINALTEVLKKEVTQSRQHYIKLKIPTTYQNLTELDINRDYSMGYPSQIGFRASTATPFYFYDLTLEMKTGLKVYPFAVMDVTLHDYLHLNPEEAIKQVRKLVKITKSVNGHFMTLWHNHTLSRSHGWEDWQMVYEEIIKLASEK